MGNLTTYLQHQFVEHCPRDWHCVAEQAMLTEELSDLLAFQARADVLLTCKDGKRRLWIEFEVSRADPVANHAKFGTAHIFEPRGTADVFVSMVSSHVTRGRHNLAAASIYLLRSIGLPAFQTLLLPDKTPTEIKALNHRTVPQLLTDNSFSVVPELERAIAVSGPVTPDSQHRVFFASNVLEVMLSLRQWNVEVATTAGLSQWGKRTVTFFVFDPVSRCFAPSKFCAFVPINRVTSGGHSLNKALPTMNIRTYAALDETETRFDGAVARNHLCHRLSFREQPIGMLSTDMKSAFEEWRLRHGDAIRIHPRGPVILQPEDWWV